MRRTLASVLAVALTGSLAPALMIALKAPAQRALTADAVVVGKVTAIEKETVEATPFPGAPNKLEGARGGRLDETGSRPEQHAGVLLAGPDRQGRLGGAEARGGATGATADELQPSHEGRVREVVGGTGQGLPDQADRAEEEVSSNPTMLYASKSDTLSHV